MKSINVNRQAAEELKSKLSSVLLLDISDPRLDMICITGVDVSKDKSVADIYVSADKSRYKEVQDALDAAKGRIRYCLASSLSWRVTPTLRFFIDTSIDNSLRIAEIIKNDKR